MILDRRRFLECVPALAPASLLASAEQPRKTRFYVLEQYFMEQGSQPTRLHEFFSKSLLPALARVHKGPVIVLDALVAPHMPQVAVIAGMETVDQVWSVSKALFSNQEVTEALDRWEKDPPFISQSASLLEAAEYSPEIVAPEKPSAPRIFELRTYHSPTSRQLKALHERFAGPEIKIFHRSGIYPVLYSTTVFGADRPNLTYLIPFESLAAREKAWAAFSADDEWVKVRKESVDRYGQITNVIQISLYRATAYSPIR